MGKTNITENMREYRKDYRLKNPDKFTKDIKCDICSGHYQICSKQQHLRTELHKTGEKIKELEDKLKETSRK